MTSSGLGVDLVVVDRITKLLQQHPAAAGRLFGSREIALSNSIPPARRDEFFAGRFAVKEAFVKAVGSEQPIDPRDIECLRAESGAPFLQLSGSAEAAAGTSAPRVSISHDGGFAIAIVQF